MREKKKLTVIMMLMTVLFTFAFLQCIMEEQPKNTSKATRSGQNGGEVSEYTIVEYSLEDDFADDTILVVLTHKASMTIQEGTVFFKEYSISDFPFLNLESVYDLSIMVNDLVMKQYKASLTGDWNELQEHVELAMLVDIDDYTRTLCLTVSESERSKENILRAIALLNEREDVMFAEPDFYHTLSALPFYWDKYNIYHKQYMERMSFPEAWDIETGYNNIITVGVIDTGVQWDHEELFQRIDHDKSYDFTNDTPFPWTPYQTDIYPYGGHGTPVAGVIAMRGWNDRIGVCWNVKIASLQVYKKNILKNKIEAKNSNITKAINTATALAIPVLNYSGGSNGKFLNSQYKTLKDYPGVFVCAAGNDGKNNDITQVYPSHYSYDLNNVISVGATWASNDGKVPLGVWKIGASNWGKNRVSLFAPGETVYSIKRNGGYDCFDGTSLASPFVAGVAALLKSFNPSMYKGTVKNRILDNVDKGDDLTPANALSNYCRTGGRLNAYKALASCLPVVNISSIPGVTAPLAGAVPVSAITPTSQYTGSVSWKVTSNGTPHSGPFAANTQYTATITLKCYPGCTFYSIPANFFTVAGTETPATNAVNSGVVTAVFPATNASTISIAAIQGVTPPVTGASSAIAITETSQFTGNIIWKNSAGVQLTAGQTFAPGTKYTATITLTAKTGFTLQGVPANFFTVSGTETPATNAPNSGVVTAKFPTTIGPLSITQIHGVTPPEPGETPVTGIPEYMNMQFNASVSWSPTPAGLGGTFAYNTVYTATITLTPKAGFTLQGVPANFFTVAGTSAPATNTANSGVVTAVFPDFNYFEGGTGEWNDPYLIKTADHFRNMEVFGNKYYKLVDDIELVEYGGHSVPIDTFNGHLDGDSYFVDIYNIEDGEYHEFTGLFRINSGEIYNLNVRGAIIVFDDNIYAGIIAGKNEGDIIDCTVDTSSSSKSGSFMIYNAYDGSYCGGIAGINEGTIGNCTNDGLIDSTGTNGDIAAVNNGIIY